MEEGAAVGVSLWLNEQDDWEVDSNRYLMEHNDKRNNVRPDGRWHTWDRWETMENTCPACQRNELFNGCDPHTHHIQLQHDFASVSLPLSCAGWNNGFLSVFVRFVTVAGCVFQWPERGAIPHQRENTSTGSAYRYHTLNPPVCGVE